MLTTYNEVNMQTIMALRTKYKDERVGAQWRQAGFYVVFVKASVEALKRFPAVNASIDGR